MARNSGLSGVPRRIANLRELKQLELVLTLLPPDLPVLESAT